MRYLTQIHHQMCDSAGISQLWPALAPARLVLDVALLRLRPIARAALATATIYLPRSSHLVVNLGLSLVLVGALTSVTWAGPAEQPKTLFEAALKADLSGDALTAQRMLLTLAANHSNTRYGEAARRRLGGGLGASGPAVVGILAAIAIPAFIEYTKRSKTTEATINLRKFFDGQVSYYYAERADDQGRLLPNRFAHTTTPAPAKVPCGEAVAPTGFDQQGFLDLNFGFKPTDRIRYQYQVISEGTSAEARFTVRAVGDLDCDGVLSTFERIGFIGPNGNVVEGKGLYKKDPLE